MRDIGGAEAREAQRLQGSMKRLAAFCGSQALGDFVSEAVFAGSVKQLLGSETLSIMFINDRPYKKFILKMLPEIDGLLEFPEGFIVPLNWFETTAATSSQCPNPDWYNKFQHMPSFFLMPSMMYPPQLLPNVCKLTFPETYLGDNQATLESLGLKPDNWFVCVHIREGSYSFRGPSPTRDVNPDLFLPSIRAIREAGGQIIRIGHQGSQPMAPMDGFIDLTQSDLNSFELQAFALSRARFNLLSESGPTVLSYGLGTPTLAVNGASAGGWNKQDRVLNMGVVLKDGRTLRTKEIISEMGLFWNDYVSKNPLAGLLKNSAKDICDATQAMLEINHGVEEWRDSWPVDAVQKLKDPRWPIPFKELDCEPALPDR